MDSENNYNNNLTFITGEMLASSCFSKKSKCKLTPKGTTHLFLCELTRIFTVCTYPEYTALSEIEDPDQKPHTESQLK